MVAARVFVESNQLDKAAERLQRVATSAEDLKLRPVAQIRLARVQAAQGKHDEALATLGGKSMGAQEPARLEARGDILIAKGDRAGALAAYEEALKLLPPAQETADGQGGVSELLELKIADLKGSSTAAAPAPAAAAPTPPPAAGAGASAPEQKP
jgi:predicted negative regulator of RcsB-dependent stress response